MQTGKYGMLLQAAPTFHYLGVTVDEVEQGFDKDIKVASMGSISEALINAFNTEDRYGNPSLNMAVIRSISFQSGLGFIQVYNALTGFDSLNTYSNGDRASIGFPMWVVQSKQDVDTVSTWDTAEGGKWVFDESVINEALGIYHPELSIDELQTYYNSITYDWAAARMAA